MSASRPAVHPVEAPPFTDGPNNLQRVRMKDTQGMPGTPGGLALRFFQFAFAAVSLSVMASTPDFQSVTAFWYRWTLEDMFWHLFSSYLVAAVGLQSLWSLSLAVVDIYALLVRRCLRNRQAVCLFTIGDGVTSTLTFAAACACAGITVLIGNDIGSCGQNPCARFEISTAMAFMSWFAVSPSFLLNFWSLASR
ncbi:CASP-like protein [Acorus gramineus]|uniref:CASP-like protein n=1 Tax=Acorus gramineus TaxID=55184 RepID=A0AAV9AQD4_ACOGR|nr:CASP-like protein [Acorus gramineus]